MIDFNLKGCIKNKGILCVPLPELIKLFERFPYHFGRDFAELFNKANISDKVQEASNEE